MLDGKNNIMTYTCNEINRTVPYFKEYTPAKYQGTNHMFEYLTSVIQSFTNIQISLSNRNDRFEEMNNLPDGAYFVRESNKKKLDYNI
jgi:hypothetical protein